MARDHNKLRVFHLADALAFDIYQVTKNFPPDEKYELARQIRKAGFCRRVNDLSNDTYRKLHDQADAVVRSLSKLVEALDKKRRARRRGSSESPKPEV